MPWIVLLVFVAFVVAFSVFAIMFPVFRQGVPYLTGTWLDMLSLSSVLVSADDPSSLLFGWLGLLWSVACSRSAFGAGILSQLTAFPCSPNWCLGVGAGLPRQCRPTWLFGLSWASGGALSGCRVKALVAVSPLGCALASAGWSSACLAWFCQRLLVFDSFVGALPSS